MPLHTIRVRCHTLYCTQREACKKITRATRNEIGKASGAAQIQANAVGGPKSPRSDSRPTALGRKAFVASALDPFFVARPDTSVSRAYSLQIYLSGCWFKAGVARQRLGPTSLGIAPRAYTILNKLHLLLLLLRLASALKTRSIPTESVNDMVIAVPASPSKLPHFLFDRRAARRRRRARTRGRRRR